jgi:hypothetical protein
MSRLLCAADVARVTHLTPAAIRSAARSGRLRAKEVTVGGVRLFEETEVVRFIRERAAQRSKGPALEEAA